MLRGAKANMRQRTISEQLDYELRANKRDKQRLADIAWDLAVRKVRTATQDQLVKAALLANHEGELGFVGRAAQAELKRRGS